MTAHTVAPTTADTEHTDPHHATIDARPTPLWRSGVRAGLLAAVATSAVAGVGLALSVPLEVDGEKIPFVAVAQLTLVCTAIGVVLAKALRRWAATPRRTFTVATVALTALSIVPDLAVPSAWTTKALLITAHLVAATIVIPALAARLPERTR